MNKLDIPALVNNRTFGSMRDGEKYIIRSIMIGIPQHWGDRIKNEGCKRHMTRMGETIKTYRILAGNHEVKK